MRADAGAAMADLCHPSGVEWRRVGIIHAARMEAARIGAQRGAGAGKGKGFVARNCAKLLGCPAGAQEGTLYACSYAGFEVFWCKNGNNK